MTTNDAARRLASARADLDALERQQLGGTFAAAMLRLVIGAGELREALGLAALDARAARRHRAALARRAALAVALALCGLAIFAAGRATAAAATTTTMSWYGDAPGEAGGPIACGTGALKRTAYAVAMRRDLTGAKCGQRVRICTTTTPQRCATPRVLDSGPYVAGRLIDALPQVLDVLGLDPAKGLYRVTYQLMPISNPPAAPSCTFPLWAGRPYWPRCER